MQDVTQVKAHIDILEELYMIQDSLVFSKIFVRFVVEIIFVHILSLKLFTVFQIYHYDIRYLIIMIYFEHNLFIKFLK